MEVIKAAMMQWGDAMHLVMENRALFYSPVLKHWRVKKWGGKITKSFTYDGDSFTQAFETLLSTHADKYSLQPPGTNQNDKTLSE